MYESSFTHEVPSRTSCLSVALLADQFYAIHLLNHMGTVIRTLGWFHLPTSNANLWV